jgi:hypothetical protein
LLWVLICRDELLISAHLSSQRGDFNLPGLERIYKQSVAEAEELLGGRQISQSRAGSRFSKKPTQPHKLSGEERINHLARHP